MVFIIKTLLLLGIFAATFSDNYAMNIKREVNETAKMLDKGYNFGYDDKLHGNLYTCQGYHECMNKLQAKQSLVASIKAEQSSLLLTMTSINKKVLGQERLINKLLPQNKAMRKEMEDLSEMLEECEEKSNKFINDIAILEADLAKYMRVIDEVVGMCAQEVDAVTVVRAATGVYHFPTPAAGTVTYWEAQNECKRNGMNLVTIDSEDEKDYIRSKIESEYLMDANWAWTWIGLNNYETSDDDYAWIGSGQGTTQTTSDGTVDTYDWGVGEPATSTTNHCVGYNLDDAAGVYSQYWVTDDCTTLGYYICELPPICYHLFDIQFRLLSKKDTL